MPVYRLRGAEISARPRRPTTTATRYAPITRGGIDAAKKLAASRAGRPPTSKGTDGTARIYTLDVSLLSGPLGKQFAKENSSVIRAIEIRGHQTREQLHGAIFDAFDRDDPHVYEFQLGKGPMDRRGPRYVLPEALAGETTEAGTVDATTIDSMEWKVCRKFGYWFDFGDDWYHQIEVKAIGDGPPEGVYPRVMGRIGESPPQYPHVDEEK